MVSGFLEEREVSAQFDLSRTNRFEDFGHVLAVRSRDRHGIDARGRRETDAVRVQQLMIHLLDDVVRELVAFTFAVNTVADDRQVVLLEVDANLVAAAGHGTSFHQRSLAGWEGLEGLEVGVRRLAAGLKNADRTGRSLDGGEIALS